MFDIAPTELLLIVVVAVLVIGPKDMPVALRAVGRWIGQIRRISGHFRSGLDAMIREAEMQEMEKKWREQNEKIMREHPADAPAEQEPTGAYPGQTVMQPLAQPGTQGVDPVPQGQSASAESRAAEQAALQHGTPASSDPLPSGVADTAMEAKGSVAVSAEAAVETPPARAVPQGAPVLPGVTASAHSSAEPVSAEARAAAIAAATGGSPDGSKG